MSQLKTNVKLIHDLITQHSEKAEHETKCKRKGVAAIAGNAYGSNFQEIAVAYNGPSHPNIDCTNEVGNCGCTHSEQKLIIDLLLGDDYLQSGEEFLLCNYSPCSACANIIAYSGIIKYVVWKNLTLHDKRGLDILNASGVETINLSILMNEAKVLPPSPVFFEQVDMSYFKSNREIINALT